MLMICVTYMLCMFVHLASCHVISYDIISLWWSGVFQCSGCCAMVHGCATSIITNTMATWIIKIVCWCHHYYQATQSHVHAIPVIWYMSCHVVSCHVSSAHLNLIPCSGPRLLLSMMNVDVWFGLDFVFVWGFTQVSCSCSVIWWLAIVWCHMMCRWYYMGVPLLWRSMMSRYDNMSS